MKEKNINFLKEYNVDQERKFPELQVKQRERVDCEKEKNKYIRRLECTRTEEAVGCSYVSGNSV